MHKLDIAILKTVIYGDIFNFPLTAAEIHHFLIYTKPVIQESIVEHLETSADLNNLLCTDGNYFALATRHDLLALRTERKHMMKPLSKQMVQYGHLLSYFPFVELVGITGALSMHNPASINDDLDYIVITRPGRVWLARGLIILLVRLMRLRDIEICPNYVLASDQLVQTRQDLYIAHEITQMLPVSNPALYKQLRTQNRWTDQHLPNAQVPFHQVDNQPNSRLGRIIKRGVETLLSTRLGDWLEHWEFRRKSHRFEQQAQAPSASAQIDEGHVKGHFNDYGHHVLAQYQAKIQAYDLNEPYVLKSAGD